MNPEERQPAPGRKKWFIPIACVVLAGLVLASILFYNARQAKQHTAATFAMDTFVTQSAYGPNAPKAMQQVNAALAEYENRLSLFRPQSDIVAINNAAGGEGVQVSEETAALLRQALELSAQSDGAFAITVAPLTQLWGITSGKPNIPAQAEIEALLPLVNDESVQIEDNTVTLPQEGMAIDLGGIAKGAFCNNAAKIYEENNVKSALLSIGGNIYAHGAKPDGSPYRIGFRDPAGGENSYIASFFMQNSTIAVSGGYERFFEQDGQKYIHILNPQTGWPAQSDIVSVGVVHRDGTVADFYSTTLFVNGVQAALRFMKTGGTAIVLDSSNNLYVSQSLYEGFILEEGLPVEYNLTFVTGG